MKRSRDCQTTPPRCLSVAGFCWRRKSAAAGARRSARRGEAQSAAGIPMDARRGAPRRRAELDEAAVVEAQLDARGATRRSPHLLPLSGHPPATPGRSLAARAAGSSRSGRTSSPTTRSPGPASPRATPKTRKATAAKRSRKARAMPACFLHAGIDFRRAGSPDAAALLPPRRPAARPCSRPNATALDRACRRLSFPSNNPKPNP